MKFVLSIIICSSLNCRMHVCQFHKNGLKQFRTKYDCLTFGLEESLKKNERILQMKINKYRLYIKFTCIALHTTTNTI